MKRLEKPSPKRNPRPKVVVIGGGTGTFVVLSGLKDKALDLTAIITVADSGGSTGRLRDEFGFLPVGDLRQSLAALAPENHQSWIRELLLYRFKKGKALKGHNLGNLILTALQDMVGSTPKALEVAGRIFRLDGHIYPSTLTNVQLVANYSDGTRIIGEHHLDDKALGGKKITSVHLEPEAVIYSKAAEAIKRATVLVIGPGDLYGSLIPNLAVKGVKEAFRQSQGKIIYVVNLMTRFTQTHGMTAQNHLDVVKRYLGRFPDVVVINNGQIPSSAKKLYAKYHEFPVTDDLLSKKEYQVVRGNFVSHMVMKQVAGDALARSLLRHDQPNLTSVIMSVIR